MHSPTPFHAARARICTCSRSFSSSGYFTIVTLVSVAALACGGTLRAEPGAAVVASGSPSPTPAISPAPTTTLAPTATPGSIFMSVNWATMTYPVACGGQTVGVMATTGAPDGATSIAVVLVTCGAGAGSPPSAILVFDATGASGAPRLRQTLISYQDDWLVNSSGVTEVGDQLSASVYGYSSASVPHCCPDLHPTLRWQWSGGQYVAATAEPPHHQLPPP